MSTFFFLPCSLWNLSSPTRDWTQTAEVKAQNPKLWATRELSCYLLIIPFVCFGFVSQCLRFLVRKGMLHFFDIPQCAITSWQIDGETVQTMKDFIFGGSKITADGDWSHEIKRPLLLGREVMTNLDSILKNRHYFANKGPSSQSCGFSSSPI